MAKNIKQTATFKVSPKEVYDALMDSKTHAKFTGQPAKISGTEGGKFSVYGGYATGVNVKLVPGKKIVQTWRASDWPEDAESTVTFELAKSGKGTKLTFTQTGVPDEEKDSIAQGWKDYYWQPMNEMFEEISNN